MLNSIYHIAINELGVYLRNRSRERWRKFEPVAVSGKEYLKQVNAANSHPDFFMRSFTLSLESKETFTCFNNVPLKQFAAGL